MSDAKSPVEIGIDTGGTFTDYVARFPDNRVETGKVPSTPEDPSESIHRVFDRLNVSGETRFVHGTTVATNALLEDDLPEVLLVVNDGLEGLAAIGRGTRRDLHDLNPDPDDYPFQELDTVGVELRDHPHLDHQPFLSDREASKLRTEIRTRNPDIVAVCLVHSYRDPKAEMAVDSALEPLDVPVVCSTEVLPRFREFERASTTVINAGLRPIISSYLNQIIERQNSPSNPRIMASDHGTMSLDEAVHKPVRTVLSGPTAGLVGARSLAPKAGDDGIITMDIGGTSTDVSLLEQGEIPLTEQSEIGSYPIAQPLADIHTIGSGGGSVVWVDDGGHLRVGPKSAGADPGPACYGQGGPPTVTDALVTLGRVPTDRPLSGDLELSEQAANESFEPLADDLDRSPLEIAEGTMRIVHSQLAEAVRTVTVEKGRRPANYSLVAFGGGGGLYGAELAENLGIDRVIQPRRAGVASAQGLLRAPRCYQATTSPLAELPEASRELPGLDSLLENAPNWEKDHQLRLEAECQFAGQTHTITVIVDADTNCRQLRNRFIQRYRDIYGYRPDETGVGLVHLNGYWLTEPSPNEAPGKQSDSGSSSEPDNKQSIYVDEEWVDVPVHRLETVQESLTGPSLLAGDTTTVFVPSNWTVEPRTQVVTLRRGG